MSRFEQKPAFSPKDERKQNADSPQTAVMCLGVAIGAGLGIAIGAALDDIGMGLCLGNCVGMCIVLAVGTNRSKTDGDKKSGQTVMNIAAIY